MSSNIKILFLCLMLLGSIGCGKITDDSSTTTTTTGSGTTASKWFKISAGGGHTIAIKTDGTLWAWGSNYNGQLGDGIYGYFGNKSSPIRIGTDTNWASISAGDNHTIAIKIDGTLWAWGWGSNINWQLGDGTYANRSSPTKVE